MTAKTGSKKALIASIGEPPLMYNLQESAARLNLGVDTFRRLLAENDIKPKRISAKLLMLTNEDIALLISRLPTASLIA